MRLSTYLLPIRSAGFSEVGAAELREYMSILAEASCEVIVIDGSSPEVFAQHHRAWCDVCRHEPVDRRFNYLNDKVNGVHTGVALATSDKIVLADDDIRYRKIDIEKMRALLDDFEVARPQNYLVTSASSRCSAKHGQDARVTLSIWAKMEAGRMLINRATLRTADYPGTCGFRRQTLQRAGEYDGDVLFDNEELIRHFARSGARICYANDFFVAKVPPSFRKWLEQRPRQAYEDFGLRFKTILFASLLPLGIGIAMIDPRWLSIFLLSILVASAGWLRGAARKYFPLHVCLFAPLWICERTLSTYWAFYWWIARGGYPFGDRVLKKGIGRDWIEGGKVTAASLRK
ncbi:MAG: glycosyltransferase [Chthoniobacterales bacterium]